MALPKEVVVVDGMVVPDIPKLCMVGANKFKDDTVGLVYSKAPHFMVLGTEFFCSQGRMERVVFEKLCSSGCFPLNVSG